MNAVLFDIDGTLLQTGGAGRIAFAETFRHLFGVNEIASHVAFAGRSDRAIAHELMQVHGVDSCEENWECFVSEFLPRLHQALLECDGAVLPGVLNLLDELERIEHVTVGLLTGNIAAGAQAKLSRFAIFDRFKFGGYGDSHLSRDDIAAVALRAAIEYSQVNRQMQLQAERVVVIGDTPADVQCARAIGAVAVAVSTGGATWEELQSAQPDLLLPDLTDPEPILALVTQESKPGAIA